MENARFTNWIFDIYDQPQPVTVCEVSPHSVKSEPAGPVPVDRHLQSNQKQKTHTQNNQTAKRSEKPATGQPEAGLSFENDFGIQWTAAHERLLPGSRAVAILLREGIEDAGEARRIIAEWAAMAARRPDGDPAAGLVWACRHQIAATREGDERLPAFA